MERRMCQAALLLSVLAVLFGFISATPLLGSKQCTWGPSFWCSNITNAKGCNAVKHCIKSVWEKQTVPVDDDEICKICTDMVQQARDQLESNQTQQDLKDVFEGSCKLIPLEIVTKECIKLVDDFIPELVETLASQMNPQVVCSVAGLCNSERIDKMLAQMERNVALTKNIEMCDGCFTVVDKMRRNFDSLPYEKVVETMLRSCGTLSSFSDGCMATVFKHFEDLYTHLKDNFYPENVCHVAGSCTYKFHQHEEDKAITDSANVEITPMGKVGRLDVNDDTTCKLCEQLVKHLSDIVIANTTEIEFKKVLEGLCKQTGSFRSECLSIVDQYYSIIYEFLVKELDPNAVCFMAGICPKGKGLGIEMDGPIAPLLPSNTAELAVKVMTPEKKLIGKDESNSYKKNSAESKQTVQILQPELSQLPIERLTIQLPQNKQVCTLCQYFLHALQDEISDPHNEEELKKAVEKICKKLPSSIEGTCESFVEEYGNAVVALLVQEIDPSQVCPALALCPSEKEDAKIDVLMTTGRGNEPNCPLCLFAVEQLESVLKNNKTEESIKSALETLCSHLPSKLSPECADFVDTYSKQLVEMMAAEFTPQEVCVFLKLCTDKNPDKSTIVKKINSFHTNKKSMADRNNYRKPLLPDSMLANADHTIGNLIATNEIPDNTFNGLPLVYPEVSASVEVKATPQCIICEFIMSQVAKELHDKSTDDEIKKVVKNVCKLLPKNVKADCNNFIDKYADAIIVLLVEEMTPEQICSLMSFCFGDKEMIQSAVFECAVCRESLDILEQLLSNPNVDRSLEHLIEKTCFALPAKYLDKCVDMMRDYGESLIHLLAHLADSSQICGDIGMCGSGKQTFVQTSSESKSITKRSAERLVGAKKCTRGPGYWCQNEETANECGAIKHCRDNYWKADKPTKA